MNKNIHILPTKLNEEVWKDVKDYEGIYKVSNFGRVKSLDREITQKNKAT